MDVNGVVEDNFFNWGLTQILMDALKKTGTGNRQFRDNAGLYLFAGSIIRLYLNWHQNKSCTPDATNISLA
jgi:hypothetical protein